MAAPTLQLGVRYDYNRDKRGAATIVANPLAGPWLPGIVFPGADPGVAFNNFSPRLGLTYDLSGNGKTVARANYARYYGQVGNGAVASTINPVGSTTLRYPWVDANGNGSADVGEITLSDKPLSASTNWSAANPANTVSANSVDQNLKNDTTDEFIVGVDREVGAGFAVGASYIWRRYGNFSWSDRQGITSADWVAASFTPAASACPGDDGTRISAANCPTVSYFQPTFQQPTVVTLTNVAGLQPELQRLRADRPQADVQSLDDEHQLRLQQHDRELRFVPWQPAEHRVGGVQRGSVEPRSARRVPVRLPDRRQRHRQRLRQRASGCSN